VCVRLETVSEKREPIWAKRGGARGKFILLLESPGKQTEGRAAGWGETLIPQILDNRAQLFGSRKEENNWSTFQS